MPGPRIYLLRHGQTVWNEQRRLQDQLDSPLTALGVEQARRNGEHLARILETDTPYEIISSPLPRAMQTTEIICKALGKSREAITQSPLVIERGYSIWEGLTWDEIETRYPGTREARARNLWDTSSEGGETLDMVAERARDWLREVNGKTQLILVSHRGFSMMLRGIYGSMSTDELLALDHHQNEFFLLDDGAITTIPVP